MALRIGDLKAPLNVSASGTYVDELVHSRVTGISATAIDLGTNNSTCTSWTNNTLGFESGMGRSSFATSKFFSINILDRCTAGVRVYCLED